MSGRLDGTTAIVTGASSGIGEATARPDATARGERGVLVPADIAAAVVYVVTRPRHASVNEILVRPMEQVR